MKRVQYPISTPTESPQKISQHIPPVNDKNGENNTVHSNTGSSDNSSIKTNLPKIIGIENFIR
ncbi:hypothetical protein A3Q56_07898 [Intoshia linei]|uniref:Uncharacterized protein n=1 Tax=Intoshia linei TaxID=1819745 RepID=A0A177AQX6_9BILA|nr:hypothetical protein A3Q56_07898 [Intoshia linei]